MSDMQLDESYEKHFSEEGFWDKIKKFALAAGCKVIRLALVLYYCWKDENTPMWAKAVITAALGYFILPLDAIPDVIPGVGFLDDLGALSTAFAMVVALITDRYKEQAQEQLDKWFGPGACTE